MTSSLTIANTRRHLKEKARLEDSRDKTHRLNKKAKKDGMKPDLLPRGYFLD